MSSEEEEEWGDDVDVDDDEIVAETLGGVLGGEEFDGKDTMAQQGSL